jgi:Zn-dependent M28 family amino/carboxypeptidase
MRQPVTRGYAALFALSFMSLFISWSAAQTVTQSTDLADAVTTRGVRAHMAALSRLADEHGGNRAAATPGYAASVRYVERTLQDVGYRVWRQPFTITFTETLAETGRVVGDGALDLEPAVMEGSPDTPEGGLQARLTVPAAPLGCAPEDFAGTRGTVVLVERGTCTFAMKSGNAARSGAAAVLIYNEASAPATEGFGGSLGDAPADSTVPTAGLTRGAGEALLARLGQGAVRVDLELRVSREERRTANVIAEAPGGAAQSVVMLGAHLDSVPAGPGVNDNGSGTALVLELALRLAEMSDADGVRFAFWGAEELGLLGSAHYVSELSPAELGNIRAYLNFDMVSSPNAAPFVYGDPELTALFQETFAAQDLTLLPDTIGGASDHAPFEAAGVLVAGLFSGASGSKSPDEARTYGGRAGSAYDPCYHQACDTLAGTDTPTAQRYLDLMADAAADALQTLLAEAVSER